MRHSLSERHRTVQTANPGRSCILSRIGRRVPDPLLLARTRPDEGSTGGPIARNAARGRGRLAPALLPARCHETSNPSSALIAAG